MWINLKEHKCTYLEEVSTLSRVTWTRRKMREISILPKLTPCLPSPAFAFLVFCLLLLDRVRHPHYRSHYAHCRWWPSLCDWCRGRMGAGERIAGEYAWRWYGELEGYSRVWRRAQWLLHERRAVLRRDRVYGKRRIGWRKDTFHQRSSDLLCCLLWQCVGDLSLCAKEWQ